MLKRRGIKHSVLNAKLHEKKPRSWLRLAAAERRSPPIWLAGVDIILGGNPEMLAAELLHKGVTRPSIARGRGPTEVIGSAPRTARLWLRQAVS
jgi:hypothetical protein